jgi:hypothetical protein
VGETGLTDFIRCDEFQTITLQNEVRKATFEEVAGALVIKGSEGRPLQGSHRLNHDMSASGVSRQLRGAMTLEPLGSPIRVLIE